MKQNTMLVGSNSIVITPAIGMEMDGFFERIHGSIGTHDELKAIIFVFSNGIKKVALVFLDTVGVDKELSTNIENYVIEQGGFKKGSVIIQATHTHSGPKATRTKGMEILGYKPLNRDADDAYRSQLVLKIGNAIICADRDKQPSLIGFAFGKCHGLGLNRNNPQAYADDNVYVLAVSNEQKEITGVIANYACHPTVLDYSNYYYSADFPGFFRNELENIIPTANVAFSQGASGEISTRYTKTESTFNEAQRFGRILCEATENVLKNIKFTDFDYIDYMVKEIEIPIKEYPSDNDLASAINEGKLSLAELEERNAPKEEIRKAYVTLQGYERNAIIKKSITKYSSVKTTIRCIDLGVCKYVGMPGEIFGEIAADIEKLSENVIVAGYANDFISYVISKQGNVRNCYERGVSYVHENTHDLLIDKTKELFNDMSDKV